eukprot:4048679-Prymnesium_polylepis.1
MGRGAPSMGRRGAKWGRGAASGGGQRRAGRRDSRGGGGGGGAAGAQGCWVSGRRRRGGWGAALCGGPAHLEQDILWLDVTVDERARVHVAEREGDARRVEARRGLVEPPLLLHVGEELAARARLEQLTARRIAREAVASGGGAEGCH